MFADRLAVSIERSQSLLVAGLDPKIEDLPEFIWKEAKSAAITLEDAVEQTLRQFYLGAIETLYPSIAAIKPNIAFFEQYGIGGLRAFRDICYRAKELSLPVIVDIKRGDIGSTAEAYANAYLGTTSVKGAALEAFHADAATINPFLGFDTLEPFLNKCVENKKGIFVLVKTSNPGSATLQTSTSEMVARWLGENASKLMGTNGFSGLGAVVGATYPEEARHLRQLMPKNFFLIPGFGAQGASASDALSALVKTISNKLPQAGIINASRGLFGGLQSVTTHAELTRSLLEKAKALNAQLAEASAA